MSAFQAVKRAGTKAPSLLQELDAMAEDEKIMKGQNDRISLPLCNSDEVARKGDEVLKMDEIGFLLFQEIRERPGRRKGCRKKSGSQGSGSDY